MVIAASILLNLVIIFFETFEESRRYLGVLNAAECVTVIIFTIEYILRLITADYAYPLKKSYIAAVAAFVFSLYGIIDLLSFAPYWLSFIFPAAKVPLGAVAFRMLRVVRIFRMFRINRYYDAFNVITDVLKEKKNQILSAVFIILMLVIASSVIMYSLEHDAQPDQFKNAFSGIWWAVSTLLTVGYGDIYPITAAGRFVGIILAFLGVGIVAIPTGIISAGFVQQYTKIRDLEGETEEKPLDFIMVAVHEGHRWCGQYVSSIDAPEGTEVLLILRGKEAVIPCPETVIEKGDRVIVGSEYKDEEKISVEEIVIGSKSMLNGCDVTELESTFKGLALRIRRDDKGIAFGPDTVLKEGDEVALFRRSAGGKM
ncbi:MAG: ion transporter [Lachnospiraceae bacterium]|nr:ion transporter [Lachnospiraceae bacterium]